MTHQIGRSHTEFFDEGNDILDVLGDRIGIADPIPMFGEEVPQAYPMTRRLAESGPITAPQMRKSLSEPCTQTKGGPFPTSR